MADEKCIIDPSRDCLGLIKAQHLEKRLDEFYKNARGTHCELYERISELEKADSARNQQYLNIMEKLNNMTIEIGKANEVITELISKPGKKWDNMSEKVLWAIIAACIGYILSQIGLG